MCTHSYFSKWSYNSHDWGAAWGGSVGAEMVSPAAVVSHVCMRGCLRFKVHLIGHALGQRWGSTVLHITSSISNLSWYSPRTTSAKKPNSSDRVGRKCIVKSISVQNRRAQPKEMAITLWRYLAWNKLYILYNIYIFIAALIFLLEYFRITRAFCILPYCTVYIVRSL